MQNHAKPHQATLIRVYTFFRLVSALVLLSLAFVHAYLSEVTSIKGYVHIVLNASYFALCLTLSMYTAKQGYRLSARQTFIAILTDQVFLVYLIYANIHNSNNFDILLLTPICMAAILFRGSLATFFAASATLGLFSVHFYAAMYEQAIYSSTERLSLFGFIFFSASLAIQYLSKRLREAEENAEKSDLHAQSLSLLNSQIVKRIRTGVMIYDQDNQLILSNPAADSLIDMHTVPFHQRIENHINQWKHGQLQPPALENINYNFSALDDRGNTIVFLEDLAEIAQHAQQLKLASLGRLTASIAHELRNPLSSISYANQLLLDSELLSSDDKELITTSEANASRINHMITDILAVSRETTGSPDKIDLLRFILQLSDDFSHSNPDANITIEYDKQCSYIAPFDKNQLRQVLVNLIENGLRYSLLNTQFQTLHIVLKLQDNASVSLDIIDQGTGVDKENKKRLFEPFFTTEKAGTGLGLYLSKELCTLNQAHLSYADTPELQGACFNIRFSHPNRDILVKITDRNSE